MTRRAPMILGAVALVIASCTSPSERDVDSFDERRIVTVPDRG